MNYSHRTITSLLALCTKSGSAFTFITPPTTATTSQLTFSPILSAAVTSASSSRHCHNLLPTARGGNTCSSSSSSSSLRIHIHRARTMSAKSTTNETEEPRKAGVASPSEIKDFISAAGSRLLIIDVRHPDATVEPGDVKSLAVAGFPSATYRPQAMNLPWSRESKSMELPHDIQLDTPIITHCGGGGRGQAAKEYLEKNGYTNVLNGGGPKETECWAEFGSL